MFKVRFEQADLERFSTASRDRNPLHLSAEYARKTPYGSCLVFGILATLKACANFRDRRGTVISSTAIEFRGPVYVGIDYLVEIQDESSDQASLKLSEGGRLVLKAVWSFCSGYARSLDYAELGGEYPREPAEWKPENPAEEYSLDGVFAPARADFAELLESYSLTTKGFAPIQVAALMWSSFLVGMHLPGKRATFWRLKLDFQTADLPAFVPFSYQARTTGFDERLDLLRVAALLSSQGRSFATAEIAAFVLRDSPVPSVEVLKQLLTEQNGLQGKRALVIGGSRGLGAAISQALALQGCTVFLNYRDSTAEAEELKKAVATAPGRTELVKGDASDIEWCRRLRVDLFSRVGGLDFLVCNACPPIRSLSFTADNVSRFQEFVSSSLALMAVPMSVFLESLNQHSGCNVLISSAAITTLPAEWPHYVTSKFALEGLVQWAAVNHKKVHFLLVRPPKLLTDQMNTPLGRQGALRVETAAARIVSRLCCPDLSASVELLESFN